MPTSFLLKFGPEIMIKSKPVKKQLIRLLKRNIGEALPAVKISGNWDHFVLIGDAEKTPKILKNIPGLSHFFAIESFPYIDFENTLALLAEKKKATLSGKSFVVRVKRSGDHDFRSVDLERFLGGGLLRRTKAKKVDLHTPEETVSIEVKDKMLFLLGKKIPGQRGFPVGAQGRVLVLISGGFDSSVAAHMMMKKGCRVDFVFCNLGGERHEKGVREVSHYLWKTFGAGYKSRFFSVDFEERVKILLEKITPRYRGILLKKMMFSAAESIADKHEAIITGESLAQVSSQTLTNLRVLSERRSIPLFRPLFGLDKTEIMQRAEDIGTAESAKKMPEYCGVISQKPATAAKHEAIEKEMKKLRDVDLPFPTRTEFLSDFCEKEKGKELPVVHEVGNEEIVIDIREKEEIAECPLSFARLLIIPFFQLSEKFPTLDRKKTYLLFCERGIVSAEEVEKLRAKGFQNVKVLRKDLRKMR